MDLNHIKRWFEHFFILPIRWYKQNYQNWRELRQRCKVCGCRDKFNFHISDEVWKQVVPLEYQNRVVCLACFDDFAKKKGVDYSTALKDLCFAGDEVSFQFQRS